MNYLLDTCLVSELTRPTPNEGAGQWLKSQANERLFLSAVTIGEIQAGIARMPDSRRKLSLVTWLEGTLMAGFEGRILSFDAEVAMIWGQKRGEAAAVGLTLPLAEGMIAATAIAHGLTVVTRNTDDLRRCGALALNPWSD